MSATAQLHAPSVLQERPLLSPKAKGAICLVLASSIWGVNYAVTKSILDVIPPMPLLSIRYFIAFFAILFLAIQRSSLRVALPDLPLLAIIGLVGFPLSTGALFIGTCSLSAGMTSLISTLSPAFIGIFAWLILKEPVSGRQWGAMGLALLGMIAIVGIPSGMSPNLLGSGLVFLSAIAWALYTVLGKLLSDRYEPLTIQLYALGFGLLGTIPFGIQQWRPIPFITPGLVFSILFLALIATALAFYLWNLGFSLLDSGTGSLFYFCQPIVGLLAGWIAFGESLTLVQWFGAGVMLLGISLTLGNKK